MKKLLLVVALVLAASPAFAQITGTGGIGYGVTLPSTCSVGDVFAASGNRNASICTAANTWVPLAPSVLGKGTSVNLNPVADSVTWKLAYGTGTAPTNAASLTGTILGATGVFKALTGMLDTPFTSVGLATGLTLNTAVWYDLQIADITGGTVTATAVTCNAIEI